jgi:deoxyribonuclease-4
MMNFINSVEKFMLIGCHVSISDNITLAVDRAAAAGCESFQLFTQNQRQWRSVKYSDADVEAFKSKRAEAGFENVPIVSHASYLINMCASKEDNLLKSRRALLEELQRCALLGVEYLVIHPGSHGGNGEEWGIAAIAETINLTLKKIQPAVKILLETTAGQGHSIGWQFEQLAAIIESVDYKDAMGVCLDTCHVFAAGYDVEDEKGWQETLQQMEQSFGIGQVKVIHLNDSKKEKGSRRDRHERIGEGFIGKECFEALVNLPEFEKVPGLLEVPGGMEAFTEDISLLKAMRKNGE